jgi:putative membrane protein
MLLAAAACNRDADQANTVNDDAFAQEEATANEPATAADSAQQFVDSAAASDFYEIEAGKLGSTKASSADLKSFAQMLVADHTKSSAELKASAGELSPALTPPTALPADKQAKVDALKAASGADFDRLFLSQQVEAHSAALDLLRGYAAGGDAATLKAFAEKTAPIVQAHLDKARTMQK